MNDYPENGTVVEVTLWIGDDPAKAREALDRELERGTPRKGVLEHARGLEAETGSVTFRHIHDGRSRTMPADAPSVDTYERHKNWDRV